MQKINYENQSYEIEYSNDFIQDIVSTTGCFFEIDLLEELRKRVKSFDGVIDIGANIGNHTFYFHNICNAKVIHAFEPIESNADLCLKNNPSANVYKVALSNYEGFCTMNNLQPWNSGTSFLSENGGETPVKTLDDYNFENITFIKVDVEGEELKVLEGMQQLLANQKPELLVEVHYEVTIEDVMSKLPEDYKYEYLGEYHYFITPHA